MEHANSSMNRSPEKNKYYLLVTQTPLVHKTQLSVIQTRTPIQTLILTMVMEHLNTHHQEDIESMYLKPSRVWTITHCQKKRVNISAYPLKI